MSGQCASTRLYRRVAMPAAKAQMVGGWYHGVILFCAALVALLTACGEPIDAEQAIIGVGGSTPEAVASSFFEDLNQALQDPGILQPQTRRTWSERLASYFAPSERVDQRALFERTLASFAYELAQIDDDQRLKVEITYTGIELVERDADLAMVQLVDGKVLMRRVRVIDDEQQEVLFEQEGALGQVIGQGDNQFPVLRVNGLWFMTDR